MIDRHRLKVFLYFLARDYLITGKIEKLLEQLPWHDNQVVSSCPLVAKLAERWMKELEVGE